MIDTNIEQQTICVIDDDKIQHFTIEKSIQMQGLTRNMICFENGEEAMTFFSTNTANASLLPDIIFLDINMPVVNGWQFLKQYELIKDQIKKEIKIYVVSSSINDSEIDQANSNIHVSGFLSKPLKPEKLREICTL
ncbi:MAG: response regulator [Pyrinomonadaceae bacterium]|nr:response regulator [Sphingobacteriaceae bacterium]